MWHSGHTELLLLSVKVIFRDGSREIYKVLSDGFYWFRGVMGPFLNAACMCSGTSLLHSHLFPAQRLLLP